MAEPNSGRGRRGTRAVARQPKNFRIHPKPQQDALSGALNELGWIQRIVVNRQSGHVIDGHLRVSLAISRNEPSVPVVYVDLSPEEESLALLTLDPLSAMAATEASQLDALLRDVQTGEAGLQAMLAELAQDAGLVPPDFEPVGIDEQGRLDEKAKATCPECGHVFTP